MHSRPIFLFMHAQFPEIDAAVSDWMAREGWPVTMRHFDFDREVLAWRASGSRPPVTLRVSLTVCDDVPPDKLVMFFQGARIADQLRSNPDAYLLVMRDSVTGGTVVGRFLRAP